MPKIAYQSFRFSVSSRVIIEQANNILAEYNERGIVVTLRQLYYQFVARDIIPNKQSEYKRLGSIINDARLAGMIDWDYLQDRTRNLNKRSHWLSPAGVIKSAVDAYHRDLWEGQTNYVEVWVEKDALLSVIENICREWDVPYFACRGYTSQSEMWAARQRISEQVVTHDRRVKIIHLGDHDPSGVDMTRDIEDRLQGFLGHHYWRDVLKRHPRDVNHETPEEYKQHITTAFLPGLTKAIAVNRIALNMDQIETYNPPPNPAKLTDSRATSYVAAHGGESWELDALDPDVLTSLIESSILEYIDLDVFEGVRAQQEEERKVLTAISDNWERVSAFVGGLL